MINYDKKRGDNMSVKTQATVSLIINFLIAAVTTGIIISYFFTESTFIKSTTEIFRYKNYQRKDRKNTSGGDIFQVCRYSLPYDYVSYKSVLSCAYVRIFFYIRRNILSYAPDSSAYVAFFVMSV